MATYSEVFRTVNFSDGEGLTSADLTALATYLEARMFDALVAGMGNGGGTGLETGPPWPGGSYGLFVLNAGQGYIAAAGGMNVKITPGMILTRPFGIAPDGLTARSMIPFTFLAEETLAVAAADGLLPRRDLVEVKLEWVNDATVARHFEDATTRAKSSQSMVATRRVQATVQVKTGTPAASPVNPGVTAGFVGWAVIEVPAAASEILNTNIRASQMPLRMECVNVHPYQIGRLSAAADPWIIPTGDRISIMAAGGTDPCIATIPNGWHARRLIAVGIRGTFNTAGGANYAAIGRYDPGVGAGVNFEPLKVLTAELAQTGFVYRQASNLIIADDGLSIWSNGYGPHMEGEVGLNGFYKEVALKFHGAAASEVTGVKFFLAG